MSIELLLIGALTAGWVWLHLDRQSATAGQASVADEPRISRPE